MLKSCYLRGERSKVVVSVKMSSCWARSNQQFLSLLHAPTTDWGTKLVCTELAAHTARVPGSRVQAGGMLDKLSRGHNARHSAREGQRLQCDNAEGDNGTRHGPGDQQMHMRCQHMPQTGSLQPTIMETGHVKLPSLGHWVIGRQTKKRNTSSSCLITCRQR